jgi:hypothetical protein
MTDSPQQTLPARPRVTLVCTGKTYLDSGKIGITFREVREDGSPGDERIYSQKNFRHVRVGAVYDAETDPANPRSIYGGRMRWLRLWQETAQAAAWQVAADAFDTRDLAMKQERKENARSLPVELLTPIREQYWSTNAAGRLAIEVRVLAYLRRIKIVSEAS